MKELRIKYVNNLILYMLFALIVPILLIANKYELWKKTDIYKLTIMGMVVLIIILFFSGRQLIKFISTLEESKQKFITLEIIRIAPLILLFFAIQYAKVQMANFEYIVLWAFFSNLVASVFSVKLKEIGHQIELYKKANEMDKIDKIRGVK